jgi:hypothetical protein
MALAAMAQQPDLTGLKHVGDGGRGFTGVAAATGYGEDQVTER